MPSKAGTVRGAFSGTNHIVALHTRLGFFISSIAPALSGFWLLEAGGGDRFLLEDGSGLWLLEGS